MNELASESSGSEHTPAGAPSGTRGAHGGGGGNEVTEGGVVSRQTVLDLSHLTSPEQLASITRIERVAAVVVRQSLAAAYAKIPSQRVGATIYLPDDEQVRVRAHTGMLTVGGDGLGAPEDVLVVVGLLVVTSPVTGPVPQRIHVIGSVIAPRGSEPALGPALAATTGTVSYYPYAEGQDVKVLAGQVQLSGASLANPTGQPDDLLIAAGQVVVTGPVTTIGFRQLVVAGQFVVPAAVRDVVEPWMLVYGQVVWYRAEEPRTFFSDARVGPDFFRLLDRPVSLMVFGDLTVDAGVTEEMVREKVVDIALFGTLTAPAHLLGVLQVRCTDMFGTIQVVNGPGS
jgi:hypothetical protein